MENLDTSSLEFNRDASTCVSDFSISLDEDDGEEAGAPKDELSSHGSEDPGLTTDYEKVSFTLAEVNF
jgi:hypothetical protein